MCHILEETVRLTDADGVTKSFGPGESFVAVAASAREPGNMSWCVRYIQLI